MKNETLGTLAVASLWICGLMGVMQVESDEAYGIVGLAMLVFVTWAGVRLYKLPVAG